MNASLETQDELKRQTISMFFLPQRNKLKVRDIMSHEDFIIYDFDPLLQVKRILEWEGLYHACVFDKQENILGILDLDTIKRLEAIRDIEGLTAREVLHEFDHVLNANTDADIGISTLLSDKFHTCPVTDGKGIIGILNGEDLFFPGFI